MSLTNTASQDLGELEAIADSLGIPIPVSAEKRIASTLANCHHKLSMLQNLLRGRPLELRPLIDSVAEVKDMARRSTPKRDPVLSLVELVADWRASAASGRR